MFNHTDNIILGVDVGGSHITAALVHSDGAVMEQTLCKHKIDAKEKSCKAIIGQWLNTMNEAVSKIKDCELQGIGIAMPGPFDYGNGISLLNGVDKYESLYGANIRAAIKSEWQLDKHVPVLFENDAACFGLGEGITGEGSSYKKIIAITLGTGFGASFVKNKKIVKSGTGVSPDGILYNFPFKKGIAEDYISSKWLIKKYTELSGIKIRQVIDIAELAETENDENAKEVFRIYGSNLAMCLSHWLHTFKADCLVIGGNISRASALFIPELTNVLNDNDGIHIPIKISKRMEISAITGAAGLVSNLDDHKEKKGKTGSKSRKSTQPLMSIKANSMPGITSGYDIYPYQALGNGKIFTGYQSLAEWIIPEKTVAIDGYIGNDWTEVRESLSVFFSDNKLKVLWYETSAFRKNEEEINKMVRPFLGEVDSVWGTKTTLLLEDFYDMEKLENLSPDEDFDVTVIIGVGSALCKKKMPVVYIDLPKNEIQYRMRAGSVANLGTTNISSPSSMYKRFYFVDWVVLNNYRKKIKEKITIVADGQWKGNITWGSYESINEGLNFISRNIIRARPWFEAGTWGGQWMKEHINSLNKNEINYAWSFELISPENGLVFESDGNLLEVAFDWLMECCSKNILGKDVGKFGTEFPIRFDFLDTFDGGSLSIQCHPSVQYIRKNFGENITQDETYYILDCKKDAGVYLGFQQDINSIEFRKVLEKSEENDTPVEIEKYVQWLPSHKHDLFLIPNGTIHSSGANNMVLEISATPYIFTFKMYDWVRLDLDGNPRPINIEHAFNNLNFDRKGEKVKDELISKPSVLEESERYTLIHLPTHKEHFYDVHRIEFSKEAEIKTEDKCHVLMLVEGTSIRIKTASGYTQRFNYAETFIIPAAAKSYQIINENDDSVKVIKAFIK